MNKQDKVDILKSLVDKGLTVPEIVKETGWGQAKVRYNLKIAKITIKHGNCNQKQQYADRLKEKLGKYNWEEIRFFYKTHTVAQTKRKFEITSGILKLAKNANLIKIRDISECQKISLHKLTGRKPTGIPKDVLEDCIKNELTLEEMCEKIGRNCGMIRRELKKHGMAALGMKSSRAKKEKKRNYKKINKGEQNWDGSYIKYILSVRIL